MEIQADKVTEDAFDVCCNFFKKTKEELFIDMLVIQTERMLEVQLTKDKIKDVLKDI